MDLWKSDEHFINACNESYQQGFKRGAREFAMWLVAKGILGNRCIYNGEITDYGNVYLAEWQNSKVADNESKDMDKVLGFNAKETLSEYEKMLNSPIGKIIKDL